MTPTPSVQVAMLGTSMSGKSSYLVATYAALAAGQMDGFFLYCRDRTKDVALLNEWEALLSSGEFPEPHRQDENVSYPFVLNAGLDPWLDFAVVDYRGGALTTDKANDADVRAMQEQLEAADCVFAVLDCRYLVDPATPLTIVRQRTQIQAITTALNREIDRRRMDGVALPSLVVLLTKADLLRPRFEGCTPEVMFKEVVDDVRRVFPLAFLPGISAMICPVRLGDFGAAEPETADSSRIDPNNLLEPIAFALLRHLRHGRSGLRRQIIEAEKSLAAAQETERKYAARAFTRRTRAARLADATVQAGKSVSARKHELAVAEERTAQLAAQIAHLPVLQDGTVLTGETAA